MIRVLQFAGCINRHDFIDSIIQHADRRRFAMGVAIGTQASRIQEPVFPEGTPLWVVPWRPRRDLITAARRLARILRDWRADVLHTHHYDEAIIGWLATRLYRRTKLVVGRHYSDEIDLLTTGLKRTALVMLERAVNRAATRIIVPSSLILDMLTFRQGVSRSKADQVPYGFVADKYAATGPTTRSDLRSKLGLEGQFVIGSFGRLIGIKGHRFLVEAMALLRSRVPAATLLIVGEGPERGNLEREINERGLGDVVRLLGWRSDAMAVMTAVDAVAHPTLHEAFCQVMVESLWMRKPLVITDVSGVRDVIRHGENGLIVPTSDPGALAHAIERLAGDPVLRESISMAGREYVSRNLSIETVIPRYERSYMRAMGICED